MLDDARAVEQARRGEEAGWRVLFHTHSDLVFRIAMRRVGDREAALDVVQDTFVRAAGAIDRYRGDGSFRAWIARIAANEAISAVRKRARRREVTLDGGAPVVDRMPTAEEAYERREVAERALAFAATLPELQREVLLLRVREGMAYAEIAAALGTTEGSARVSYHHALRKLREHLDPAGSGRAGGPADGTAGGTASGIESGPAARRSAGPESAEGSVRG